MTLEGHATRRQWLYLLATFGLIAVATFPWDLQDHPHWYKVAWVPFATGIFRLHDVLLNAALYFPLGFFLPIRPRRQKIVWAIVVSLLASAALEVAQVWSHARFPSMTDLTMNVIGGAVGAAAAKSDRPSQ